MPTSQDLSNWPARATLAAGAVCVAVGVIGLARARTRPGNARPQGRQPAIAGSLIGLAFLLNAIPRLAGAAHFINVAASVFALIATGAAIIVLARTNRKPTRS